MSQRPRIPAAPRRIQMAQSTRMQQAPRMRYSEQGQWHHLYNNTRWRKLRAAQLQREPLCRMCHDDGQVREASVCDHIEPHRGDEQKFWVGPFQSLCQTCHNGRKQAMEKSGRVVQRIGLDGWPECS